MAVIRPREAEHIIYQGDDLPRLAELRRAAEVARRQAAEHEAAVKDGSARMGDDAPLSADAEAAYDGFVAEAAERAVIVRVRHLGRRRFADLMDAHPPRTVAVKRPTEDDPEREVEETHPDDAPYQVNTKTFPDALLTYWDDEADVATIVEPDLPTKRERKAFVEDELAEGDFDELWLTAYYLNRNPTADPKALLYSSDSRRSSET